MLESVLGSPPGMDPRDMLLARLALTSCLALGLVLMATLALHFVANRGGGPERPVVLEAEHLPASPPKADREPRPCFPTAASPADGPVVRFEPAYPADAAHNGIEGLVVMGFDVDPMGRVANIRVLGARPQGVFESAVRQALRRWRYRPAVENGRAVWRRQLSESFPFRLRHLRPDDSPLARIAHRIP